MDQLDGRWSEEAYDLRDSYVPVRDAMEPVALAQGTERLRFFVQEEAGELETRLDFEGVTVRVTYRHRKGMARGMVVRLSTTEFVVLGVGFQIGFVKPDGAGIPLVAVERGRFEGGQWRPLAAHPPGAGRPDAAVSGD